MTAILQEQMTKQKEENMNKHEIEKKKRKEAIKTKIRFIGRMSRMLKTIR